MSEKASKYLSWGTKKIDPAEITPALIDSLYAEGYVATRIDRGIFNQTRSVRIKLPSFEPSSENRRILRKNETVSMTAHPLPYADYHWSIHKLAKDFYTDKFGEDTFSANKIKEIMTDASKSNFNTLLAYKEKKADGTIGKTLGYCIALKTDTLLHYSYPFYVRDAATSAALPSLGLGMMTSAILWAKEKGLTYAYLGSLQRPTDTYKLQFTGMEWFDGTKWQNVESSTDALKKLLA